MPTTVDFKKGEHVLLTFNTDEILATVPHYLSLLGAAVASWSWAEHHFQNVRAVLELTEDDLSFSNFECPKSTPAQLRLLKDAAEKHIRSEHARLFSVALEIAKRPAGDRNSFSHGIIAYCPSRPTGLVLYKQEDQQKLYRKTFALGLKFAQIEGDTEQFEAATREAIQSGLLYEPDDFRKCMAANKLSADILLWLAYLGSNDPGVVNLGVAKLMAIPEVAREFPAAA